MTAKPAEHLAKTKMRLEILRIDLQGSPEQFLRTAQLVLLRLARERLTDRERQVFFGIHFDGLTRATLAADLGLTPQAIGQMYVRVSRSLYALARTDPAFPTTDEGRTP